MRERAVHDRIGADVEEPQVHVAEPLPQVEEALRMAQRDVQHLVCDEAGLAREREACELRTVEDGVAVGRDRRRVTPSRQVAMSHPERKAAR